MSGGTYRFMRCSKCEKKLIVQKDSGLYHFAFGRMLDQDTGEPIMAKDEDGRIHPLPAVEIMVQGVIRMRCFSVKCREVYPDHWNEFHLFDEE